MAGKEPDFDVMIAGGGPAGMSALLWCADLGLSAVLFERSAELGGQLLHTHNPIKNYLGIETENGRELRDIFFRQMENTKMEWLHGCEIVDADLLKKTIAVSDGTMYSGRAVIIATGVRRRKLMVPGEGEFWGRGVLESGVKEANNMLGKTVLIVGGGDAALENAILLSRNARKIYIVHRRAEFTARKEFIERAKRSNAIEFITDSRVTGIRGKEHIDIVELEHLINGTRSQVETDAVLIRIGVEPNTETFRGQIDLDGRGYVIIDNNCQTSLPGVFAVGDAANRTAPTIAAAVGHGATAAKAIFEQLGP